MSITYLDVTCVESGLESPPLSQMSSIPQWWTGTLPSLAPRGRVTQFKDILSHPGRPGLTRLIDSLKLRKLLYIFLTEEKILLSWRVIILFQIRLNIISSANVRETRKKYLWKGCSIWFFNVISFTTGKRCVCVWWGWGVAGGISSYRF